MRSFMYTIKAPVGLHARHAGLIVKQAREFASDITVRFAGKEADAKRVMALMTLGVHQGDAIAVTIEGEDEDLALSKLKSFFFAHM
ncbi:MAG: HPr family phosphocarrier protein [Oscillospiraceae bacterium]|nr:HPr family phosphocarrier protein [Oscillospiraceae bacterium]